MDRDTVMHPETVEAEGLSNDNTKRDRETYVHAHLMNTAQNVDAAAAWNIAPYIIFTHNREERSAFRHLD